MPSSRNGSHSLTLMTVGGRPSTSSRGAEPGTGRGLRPFTGDVGAQGVDTLDEAEFTILLQLHAYGENQVAAATFSSDDDALRINLESGCIRVYPLEARDAIV